MLTLVASPIGNLADLSYRAVETLKNADLILCEDTRHSAKLLAHYEIHRPLRSYHKFNEAERITEILEALSNGQNIALLSDAGTPGIADPGERLVRACIDAGQTITMAPGPCAIVQALVISGFPTQPFQFTGFIPRKNSERRQFLLQMLQYPGTSICYETGKRLLSSLELLLELDADRPLVVARELTKLHENYHRGTAKELLDFWTHQGSRDSGVKGECVLVTGPAEKKLGNCSLSLTEHVSLVQVEQGLSKQDAIKKVAKLRDIPKRTVYQAVHGIESIADIN